MQRMRKHEKENNRLFEKIRYEDKTKSIDTALYCDLSNDICTVVGVLPSE